MPVNNPSRTFGPPTLHASFVARHEGCLWMVCARARWLLATHHPLSHVTMHFAQVESIGLMLLLPSVALGSTRLHAGSTAESLGEPSVAMHGVLEPGSKVCVCVCVCRGGCVHGAPLRQESGLFCSSR